MNTRISLYVLGLVLCSLLAGCANTSTTADGISPGGASPTVYNVRSFGAKGDGTTIDSPAINKAIDAANAGGGGTVLFPPGTYLCFSIHLKSNVCLSLDQAATILAADNPLEADAPGYDAPEPNQWDPYEDFGHSHWHNSLIWGENLENISIIGLGRIDGKGLTSGANPRKRNAGASNGTRAARSTTAETEPEIPPNPILPATLAA